MTGNPNFLTPNPPLLDLTAAANELLAAIEAAKNGGKTQFLAKRKAVANVQKLLKQVGAYVQNISDGDEVVIDSAGFDTARKPEPVGILPAPSALAATISSFEGAVDLDWDPVAGSHSYTVYMKDSDPDDGQPWLAVHATTKSGASISDLESGKFYWFRVTAFGAAGSSPVSDPARSFAA